MWRMWLLFKSKEQCDTSQTNPYRKGSSSGLPWLWTVLTSDRPGVELSSVMTSASNQAQKRFKCDECDYESNYKCNLKQHESNHTGEKPFECNFCEKKFSQSQTLENHRNEISYFQRIWNWPQWFWWKICLQHQSPTSALVSPAWWSLINPYLISYLVYGKSLKDKFILAGKRSIVINVILRRQTKPGWLPILEATMVKSLTRTWSRTFSFLLWSWSNTWLKGSSEGSDIVRLENWMTSSSIDFESI